MSSSGALRNLKSANIWKFLVCLRHLCAAYCHPFSSYHAWTTRFSYMVTLVRATPALFIEFSIGKHSRSVR